MSRNTIFWFGIFGVTLFAVASILGGFQFDDYNPVSQYISETMAVGTPYGETLRYFGYIPSGLLIALFSFFGLKKMPESKLIKAGFWGVGIFYGLATILVGIFPCDRGCNKEFVDPSISQLIHNLTGLLTYIFVPVSILAIGFGLRGLKDKSVLGHVAILCGLFAMIFIGLLISDPLTGYAGLFQRIVEGTFIIWIISCSLYIKRDMFSPNKPGDLRSQ